ncbi:hypothetical protein QTJ16_001563 [Diplocarpon rosae]|uniref:Conserved oligomeric Golgi complex subunit 1 n=1 Tax=Diplocarpon rosae TaxID=946125 RepID=A0AAD9T531_9HELO|nr:hypothetical protein QTJ16_001563 [Diplocarpon rosae]PBP15692.1 hypothetical protein BUE80_DR013530 [Diplocarpon rosae]
MAANKTLDPASCTSATDAFRYPLPQVRQFHRSLTAELDEKNARLRTMVGGSYRQLLGTAETILQMREDIGHAEEKLGRVGKGCGRAVVGAKASGLANLQEKRRGEKRGEDLAWAAKTKALEMCGIAVGKLLRKGGNGDPESTTSKGKSLVLAAKVLVLSRLLAKSVGDMVTKRSQEDQYLVEGMKRKLGSLRRRLLRAIEKTFERIGEDGREGLIQALSAHSLATSSGAKDVIRHFLHIRGEAMALAFDKEDQNPDHPGVVRALELYTRTLLDVQALVPRRISEALVSLKSKSLLKDESIRTLEGLRLDVCEKWFGDEILFFTPYIRHDDLEGSQAVEMLHGWSKKASEVMLQGLAKTLDQLADFKTVVGLRTQILEIWIKEGGKAKGFDPFTLLNGLRKVINDRMVALVESRVSKLHLVGTEIEGTLSVWRPGTTDRQDSLWDESLLEMEISNGATLFKQGVLARTHGRSDAVSRVFRGYQAWRHLIDEVIVILEQLKKQRWDDDLEDIEDDLSVESRHNLLSTDDPKMLQEHLDTTLEEAYRLLHDKISALLGTYEESEQVAQMSMYLLRIIRDIRSELPKNTNLQGFGLPLVSPLHQRLVSEVSAAPLRAYSETFTRKRVPGRALWEGTPELPVQPSPGTFKLLHSLSLAMAKVGGDLWSPAAVRNLKQNLRAGIGQGWSEALVSGVGAWAKVNGATDGEELTNMVETNHVEESTHGDEAKEPKEEAPKDTIEVTKTSDVFIQSLFDVLLLQSALELPDPGAEDGLVTLGSTIEEKLELDAAARKRLRVSAKDYWKRTSLLFGLLA